jgi:DNA-binding MarR family transcriptional regulator
MSGSVPPLQRELRQTRAFETHAHEAVVGLFRTADVVRRHVAAVTEARGLTVQQFNVLRILRGAGDGVPTLEIAERMVEQTPGITRLLDRLEHKGLVSRVRCKTDRRQVLCRITAPGLKLLAGLDGPIQDATRGIVQHLSRHEQTELIRLLDSVRSALSGDTASPSR